MININGNIDLLGYEVPVIEGGFGDSSKCLLARDIAKIHEVEMKAINRLINNNVEEFIEGEDILDLKVGAFDAPTLESLGFSTSSVANANNIYLLSESGYMALVMLMKTDKAREIRLQIRREYFSMRKELKGNEKNALLIQLFDKDPLIVAKAHNRLVELEKAPLIEKINEQEPKVEYYERVLQSESTFTITQIAKDYGMSAISLNTFLGKMDVQFRSRGQWVLYSTYAKYGYTESDTQLEEKNGTTTVIRTKWTQKGREFIHSLLVKHNMI